MLADRSPRQEVLRRIWDSHGPEDLMVIMASSAIARDPTLVDELESQAAACEAGMPEVAVRLREMSHAMRHLHDLVSEFAKITDMRSLAEWYHRSDFCFSRRWLRLVGGFVRDAVESRDCVSQETLRRALRIRTNVARVVAALPRTDIQKQIDHEPLLSDPAFHEFLDTLSQTLAKERHAAAEPTRRIAAYLKDVKRLNTAMESIKRTTPHGGQARLPINATLAELWFVGDKKQFDTLGRIADSVAAGAVSISEGRDRAHAFLAQQSPEASPADIAIYATAAYCEYLLRRERPELLDETIALYRTTVGSTEWSALVEESRATYVLRYGMAVVHRWRQLHKPIPVLDDAVSRLTWALSVAHEDRSPRLLRDLRFTRARLLENLGIWRPENYRAAEEDYVAGLAVTQVAHEAEARGRALFDLANTMSRNREDDRGHDEDRIFALYEEALRLLPSDESVSNRAAALIGFSAHLMERPSGDPAYAYARALEFANEAISILEGTIPTEDRTPYVLSLLAGAYLHRGNAMREIPSGPTSDRLAAAIESYRVASDILKEQGHTQLRGIILINTGHVALDYYELTGDPANLRDAAYAYGEAADSLQEYPCEYGYALFRRALLATMADGDNPETVETALAEVRMAIETLRSVGDRQKLAQAIAASGIVLRARSRHTDLTDLEEAALAFAEAHDLFSETRDAFNAIFAARQVADARVTLFGLRGTRADLKDADNFVSKACDQIEQLWARNGSMEWRANISLTFSTVYDEKAWCLSMLGKTPLEVLETASLSKARELVAHVSSFQLRRTQTTVEVAAYLDLLRVETQRLETSRWIAQRGPAPQSDLADHLRSSEAERKRLRDQMEFFQPRVRGVSDTAVRARIDGFLECNRKVILCDLIVTRWGSLAILVGTDPKGHFAKIVQLPGLDKRTLQTWLHGADEKPGWLGAYQEFTKASAAGDRRSKRAEWAEATDQLLADLGEFVVGPILETIGDDVRDRYLFLSPGLLAGLPIHAVPSEPSGKRLFEDVKGFAYVPSPVILRPESYDWSLRGPALCILSDFERRSDKELREAPIEVSEVANLLASRGLPVTVIAAVGTQTGRTVFEDRGIKIAEGVAVSEGRPSRDWMRGRLSEFGHVFYSGHGVAGGSGDAGLVLIEVDGVSRLTPEDLLRMPELAKRPLVYLSACEVAQEATETMELFSFASALIRGGAGFVIGNMWRVGDECSRVFATAFYRQLVAPTASPEAFCSALRQLVAERASKGLGAEGIALDHPIYWAGFVPLLGA